MKLCTRCILPETYEGITFDKKGVCNYCHEHEKKEKIDWQVKEKKFRKIIAKCKKKARTNNSPYDCVVPFSGGKDSTFTLYTMVKKYKLRCIAATFDHCFITETMRQNHQRIFRQLKAAHIIYKPDWDLVKQFCKKAYRLTSDYCWHCHLGVYSFPMRVAAMYKVPLIVWGTCDYSLIAADRQPRNAKRFKEILMKGFKINSILDKNITKRDLGSLLFPKSKDLKGVLSINQGRYHHWNAKKQAALIKKKLGWQGREVEGSYVDWDNVECKYVTIRDFIKYLKRGYGRTTQLISVDIRRGLISREKALKISKRFDGKEPKNLKEFLKDINITKEEFLQIAQKHKVGRSRS